MRSTTAMVFAGALAVVWPSASALSGPIVPDAPTAGPALLVDGLGQPATGPAAGPAAGPGGDVGTYVHRFGRLHDQRRLGNDPFPGSPQHRFGQPGTLGVPGRFVRPDRIGPFDRRPLPGRLGD